MDWVKAGNEFLIRLGGGWSVCFAGLERRRRQFLSGAAAFFIDVDHTILVCGLGIVLLGLIFWFSLRRKAEH
jgi:hypothetical protein